MAATDNRKVVEGVHKMTPSEAFVETCVANGVSEMFGIMGSAFMDAMDIFAPAGIRLIPVVHEQGAAHMADGYARVSGRHGVVIGQNGPGISNCVTGIAAAYWAHSPVVIVTPETGTMGMGLGGFQEANQLPMFQEFTKYQGHVCNPKRMAEFTGRVFDRAMSEMGPTQLNIPRDYFYGEIECEIPKPMRVDRGHGGEASLQAAVDLLKTAKFPVILAGGGVVMGEAIEECKALAERYAQEYTALTEQIKAKRTARMDLLNGADLPLTGLGVEDGSLTYNGKHWQDISGSDQLRVAAAIVRRLNPDCGFVLLDKLEQMDLATLAEFGSWLQTEGLQAIATRVSTGGECQIIIEDGMVKDAEPPVTEKPQPRSWTKGAF